MKNGGCSSVAGVMLDGTGGGVGWGWFWQSAILTVAAKGSGCLLILRDFRL